MTRGTHSFGKRRCWSTVMLNGPKDCLGESRFWGLVLAEDNTGQSLFFRVIRDQGMEGQKMTTWKKSL